MVLPYRNIFYGEDEVGAINITELTDVELTNSLANNGTLKYNSTSGKWADFNTITLAQFNALEARVTALEPSSIAVQLKTPNYGQSWSSITLIDNTGVNHLSSDSSYWGKNQTRTVNLSPGTSPVITMISNSGKFLHINNAQQSSGNYTIPDSQITTGSQITVHSDFDD